MQYIRRGDQLSIYFGFDHDSAPYSLFMIDEGVLWNVPKRLEEDIEFDDRVCLSIGFQHTVDLQRAQGTREEIVEKIQEAFHKEWAREANDPDIQRDIIADYLDEDGGFSYGDLEAGIRDAEIEGNIIDYYPVAYQHKTGLHPSEDRTRALLNVVAEARQFLNKKVVEFDDPSEHSCVFIYGVPK